MRASYSPTLYRYSLAGSSAHRTLSEPLWNSSIFHLRPRLTHTSGVGGDLSRNVARLDMKYAQLDHTVGFLPPIRWAREDSLPSRESDGVNAWDGGKPGVPILLVPSKWGN